MKLEELIGQKINAEVVENDGAAGGVIKVNEEDLDFIIGRIENGEIIYSTKIKPGKNRIKINQIDVTGNYKLLLADLSNPLPIQELSKELQQYISDSTKITSLEEFTTKYAKLEAEITPKSEDEKREATLAKFRKKYFNAKEDMLKRFEKEKLTLRYIQGTIRTATLDDLLDIEKLSQHFYNQILINKEDTADVTEVINDAKSDITKFYIQEHNNEIIGILAYNIVQNLPFSGAIGVKDHNIETLRAFLHKTMSHISCKGFFREAYVGIENQDFYKQIGFKVIEKYKGYSEVLKKNTTRNLLYLPPSQKE